MIRNAEMGKEIVVMSSNRVGILSSVAKLLADRGINIIALSAQAAGGVALMNMVVDEHLRACDLLRKNKFPVHENNIVMLEVEDKPGVLKYVTARLAARKVDILNIYGSASSTFAPCVLALSTTNNQKALVALKNKR